MLGVVVVVVVAAAAAAAAAADDDDDDDDDDDAAAGLLVYDALFLIIVQVWLDAASQIFFSLSTSTGSLTAMASYSKFKNNSLRSVPAPAV